MPFKYKEHEECRNCKYSKIDAKGGDSWHCDLDLSMLGDNGTFIEELKEECERFENKLDENYRSKQPTGFHEVEEFYEAMRMI